MKQVYHVSKLGNDQNVGSQEFPFLTISKATTVASEADTVIVHEGTYREWVRPYLGGYDELGRVVYEAAKGENVIIKGSEIVTNWENVEDNIWRVVVPNTIFKDYNPYVDHVEGDWCFRPVDWQVHTGDVYFDGQSMYEARTYEDMKIAEQREKCAFQENSVYQWFSVVDDVNTTIYGNFHEINPNEVLTEINVRKCCFFPERTGVNYITVRGFEMAHAATQWAPPTAEQIGMVGPHWSKGWVIEDNILHDSKCSGVSLGKDQSSGQNEMYYRQNKAGYHYQLELVFTALRKGWNKEEIGSHIVRNNLIYNCGQTGIVGHMGCVFSEIYGNHIYNIGTRYEFDGFEKAGIKLHAPIDVQIYENCIHDCVIGVWMDWQHQGTRISKNFFFNNEDQDCFIEISHGPCLIDNNIFASEHAILNASQGTAFVNNLFAGYLTKRLGLTRTTPYHLPHSTQVKGCSCVYMGDDRYYNNIFIGNDAELDEVSFFGTNGFPEHLSNEEEYLEEIRSVKTNHQKYFNTPQVVYFNNNVYYNGAEASPKEKENFVSQKTGDFKIIKENDAYYVEFEMENEALIKAETQGTHSLGKVRLADARYEKPDGSMLLVDKDYLGNSREAICAVGPFNEIKVGKNRFKIWG